MAGDATLEHLRSIPLFSELDDASLERIRTTMTEFEVPAGHVLIERGMEGSGLFVIEEGSVHVELPEQQITLSAGEFIGELSLLASAPHTARVRAAEPLRGLAIARKQFLDLLHEEPRIAVPMLGVLARRLASTLSHH